MNNCEMYQELISRLVDGELSRREYAALDAHMENCAECSAMYAVFASLSDIIGSENEPLPETLHDNIMAGVRRSAMLRHNRRRLSKPVRNTLAAAACAALVIFASRGLAPADKAADAVLSQDQAAVMDAQVQEEAPAPAAIEEAAVEESAAVSVAETPVVTAMPVATPVPTEDIYLESESEAKNAAENTSKTKTVVATPKPTEIPVHTPVTVATPQPTQSPAVVVSEAPVADSAEPVEQPAEPVEEAGGQPEEEAAPAALEPESEPEKIQPAPAEENVNEILPAAEPAAVSAVPETVEPIETETPSLSKRFFSFFAMGRPEADSNEAAAAAEESPAELAEAKPEAAVVKPELAKEKDTEKKKKPIRLESEEKLLELEALLDGVEAEFPETKADAEYRFVLREPEEEFKDYELLVCIYGDKIYYEQRLSEDEAVRYKSECSIEDFEKFMDGLSDEEKGVEPSFEPSAAPAAVSSPAVSEMPENQASAEPEAVQ